MTLSFGTVGVTRQELASGEPVDVVILTDVAIDDAARQGAVVPGSRADLARTGMGLGVREGAPLPDIAAKSLVYVDPAQGATRGGIHFASVLDRLGIANAAKGVVLVGPLPPDLQKDAAPRRGFTASSPDPAGLPAGTQPFANNSAASILLSMSFHANAVGTAKSAWGLVPLGSRESMTDLGPPRDFWLLEHDPSWLASRLGTADRAVLLAMKDEECFCGLFVHDVGLDLGLGEVSLGAIPVRRHVLTGGLPEKAATAEELAELLRLLATEIGPKGVVFLQGVHDDEALRVAIDSRELRRSYFVLQHGPSYRRCRITLDGSFDDYLATLKKGARTDLRRIMRKFTEQFGKEMELQVVNTERDLEVVLPELERLSATTYQAKHLGLGISPGSLIEQQLRFGVSQGMARLDLLRVGGQLISFQIAYIHSATLDAVNCGYDAAWSEWGPGIAHLGFIVEDVCRSLPRVRTIDMMYGESLYKTKLCNTFHREAHFYLIPRTARGFAPWLAMRTVGHVSRAAGALAARMKHKKTVARFIRHLAERRASIVAVPSSTSPIL